MTDMVGWGRQRDGRQGSRAQVSKRVGPGVFREGVHVDQVLGPDHTHCDWLARHHAPRTAANAEPDRHRGLFDAISGAP